MIKVKLLATLLILAVLVQSCKKDNSNSNNTGTGGTGNYKLAYPDSIIYPLGEQSNLQIINPVTAKQGIYTSFPDGLAIDTTNGNISIHESETGIKYRIYFTSLDGTTKDSTLLTLSGINFLDGVYKINTSDSIINPVYNSLTGNSLPTAAAGSVFDEGGGCNSNGCAVNLNDARINLAQTLRNGTFGSNPSNGSNKTFTLNFRLNDRSLKGGNKLKIKIFYFKTINDVTAQVWDILNGRNGTVINSFNNNNNTPIQGFTAGNITQSSLTGKGRRPPCVVILTQ